MKKTLAILLATILMVGLCACGGNAPAKDNNTDGTTTTTATDSGSGDTTTNNGSTTTTTTTEGTFTYDDENVFNDATLAW